MNNNISSLQCAYEFLRDNPGAKRFSEIWNYVVETLNIENPENRVSTFYTNLLLDGRIVTIDDESKKEKLFDLRERKELKDYYSETRNYYYNNEILDSNDSNDEANGSTEDGEQEGSEENNSTDY